MIKTALLLLGVASAAAGKPPTLEFSRNGETDCSITKVGTTLEVNAACDLSVGGR